MSDLRVLARNDNILRAVRNVYMDQWNDGHSTWINLYFVWDDIAFDIGVETNAETYANDNLRGYDFLMTVNDFSDATREQFVTGARTIRMLPPETISSTDGTFTWDATTGISFDGPEAEITCPPPDDPWGRCDDADYDFQLGDGEDIGSLNMLIPGFYAFDGDIPEGIWELQVDDATIGKYDLNVANPYDASGTVIVPIPQITVVETAAGNVEKIMITWRQHDPDTGTYQPVSASSMKTIITDAYIDLRYGSDGRVIDWEYTDDYSVWTPPAGTEIEAAAVSGIIFAYIRGWVRYRFGFGY